MKRFPSLPENTFCLKKLYFTCESVGVSGACHVCVMVNVRMNGNHLKKTTCLSEGAKARQEEQVSHPWPLPLLGWSN